MERQENNILRAGDKEREIVEKLKSAFGVARVRTDVYCSMVYVR